MSRTALLLAACLGAASAFAPPLPLAARHPHRRAAVSLSAAAAPADFPAAATAPRRRPLVRSALTLAALTVASRAAVAATGGAAEHLHIGQKVAAYLRRSGLSDEVALMVISGMPVVELRGGVPVGAWMGLPAAKVLGLCVAGNMIPIPILLLALQSKFVQKVLKPVLDRAKEKASAFGDERSQAFALAAFVGVPLPGTGAWTGAMGAFLLGMPFTTAMASIFSGVVAAGCIMTALAKAGWAGVGVATVVIGATFASQWGASKKE